MGATSVSSQLSQGKIFRLLRVSSHFQNSENINKSNVLRLINVLKQGNVHTHTMRAFTVEEMTKILAHVD